MDEVFIAVEQHRRCSRFSGLLNRLPLAQQGFQILNQQVFADAVGFRTNQKASSRRLDQNTQCTQSVPLCIGTDAPGDVDPLAMGLEHQVATWQSQISRQPRALGAGRFLHHLNQNLLTRLQKFSDPSRTFLQTQRPKISDMNEPVFLTLTNIDEGSINAWQNIFNRS